MVTDAIAEMQRPRNGKDADPAMVVAEVRRQMALFEPPKVKDGERGPQGLRGPEGPEGPVGPKPKHEWKETELRFEKPDGTWGKYVDLRGPQGWGGAIVQTGTDAPPFDIDSLPIGDTSTPEEIVVKQHGEWVRIPWDTFVDLVGVPTVTLEVSLNDDLISLNDDQLGIS